METSSLTFNTAFNTHSHLPPYFTSSDPASNSILRKLLKWYLTALALPWLSVIYFFSAIFGFGRKSTSLDGLDLEGVIGMGMEEALRAFDEPNLLPPGSRTNPWVVEKPDHTLGLFTVVKLSWFFNVKALQVSQAILSHFCFGPKLRNWNLEITIVNTLMHNLSKHSDLANWSLVRLIMDLIDRFPMPKGYRSRPIDLTVPRLGLPGILKDYDEAETGKRVLKGRWFVDQKIWEGRHIGYLDAKHLGAAEKVMLYLHGGAYCVFSVETHQPIIVALSKSCGMRVFAVNYRLAPETRFPGALHDAVVAYFHLVNDLEVPPSHIVLAGDSAGGGLALALMLYLRDSHLPLPGGALLLSPWCDLSLSCRSWDTNAEFDVVPLPEPGCHFNPVECYLGYQGLRSGLITHPYVSPLFGKYDLNQSEGRDKLLPPILIQFGTAEVLRDECTLLAWKAHKAGVKVICDVYQDMVHVFQTFTWTEPAKRAFDRCAIFVNRLIPEHQAAEAERLRALEASGESSSRTPLTGQQSREDETTGTGRTEPTPLVSRVDEIAAETAIERRVDEEIGGGDRSEMVVVDERGVVRSGDEVGEGEDRNIVRGPVDEQREAVVSTAADGSEAPAQPSPTPMAVARQRSHSAASFTDFANLNHSRNGTPTPPSTTPDLPQPQSQRQRSHVRRWTGLSALQGFTPLRAANDDRPSQGPVNVVPSPSNSEGWNFTSSSLPTSPLATIRFARSAQQSPDPGAASSYFNFSPSRGGLSSVPTSPPAVPGVRRRPRVRSSTAGCVDDEVASMQVQELVRQWTEERRTAGDGGS